MRRAFVTDKRTISVKHVYPERATKDYVIVRVLLCGICGSDLKRYETFGNQGQFTLGHELLGLVVRTDPSQSDLKGRYVSVRSSLPCLSCEACLNNKERFCESPNRKHTSCGFSDEILVPIEYLFFLNESPMRHHVLLEPMAVALSMLETSPDCVGQRIAVLGGGTISLLVAWLLKRFSFSPVTLITDHLNSAIAQKAVSLGVDICKRCDAEHGSWNVLFVTSPYRDMPYAVRLLKVGGVVTYIGYQGYVSDQVLLDFGYVHRNSITIRGCSAHPQILFDRAWKLIKEYDSFLDSLISPVFNLDDIECAFKCAQNHEFVKTVVGDNVFWKDHIE